MIILMNFSFLYRINRLKFETDVEYVFRELETERLNSGCMFKKLQTVTGNNTRHRQLQIYCKLDLKVKGKSIPVTGRGGT
jgi:hypothetical protein